MSNRSMQVVQIPSVDNLRQTFDNAIARAQECTGSSIPRSRMPIAVRPRPTTEVVDNQAAEKKALVDAARALARLWNVSANLVR